MRIRPVGSTSSPNGKEGKREKKDGDTQKSKTINGKKYEFDTHGAMTAEWSLDVEIVSY